MKITVVGGGNIGTQFAVHSAEKGHEVKIYTSNPRKFSNHLSVVDKSDNVIHEGDIVMATKNAHEAFHDADMIMITMPATMMIPLAEIIYEHTDSHTVIGFVPGNGGFEFAFKECIERGNTLFGIDRVPAIARLKERGKSVRCSGYKDKLYVAAIPSSDTEECAALIENIYDIPCVRLPGFMALTLTPSNPILHTARLKTIFKDYEAGVTYDYIPLFYEEWDDESSELLLACDDEIQEICKALPEFGLEHVVSEREFYSANTPEEMTRAISTEESLLGFTTPAVKADAYGVKGRGLLGLMSGRKHRGDQIEKHISRREEWRRKLWIRRDARSKKEADKGEMPAESTGLIPDLHSRYFTSDFPYGLTVIQQIGRIAGVSMPNIDSLIEWYDNIALVNDKLYLSDYGIKDMNDLRDFYLCKDRQAGEPGLTHFDERGNARMVDVSDKSVTRRTAVAEGSIKMNRKAMNAVLRKKIEKGDVLTVAQVAGIMGTKRTPDLIPMCHPIVQSNSTVGFEVDENACEIKAICTATTEAKTGVEMEALTGVSVTLLTIYDMCKAVDKRMEIKEIRLVSKTGGKSGDFIL